MFKILNHSKDILYSGTLGPTQRRSVNVFQKSICWLHYISDFSGSEVIYALLNKRPR